MPEYLRQPESKKISALRQIVFDVRLAVALLTNSLRVNATFFHSKNFDGSDRDKKKLSKIEKHELRMSQQVNKLLQKFGVNFTIEGQENVPDGPVIFLARHESWWDTVGLQAILQEFTKMEHLAKYLSKKELLNIKVFGTAMRNAGHIAFDRKGENPDLIGDLRFVLKELKRSIIIFPEGTRKKRGVLAESGRYRKPGEKLEELGAPFIPVYICSHAFGRNEFFIQPKPHAGRRVTKNAEVKIIFGEPLSAEDIGNGKLEEFMRAHVERHELPPGEQIRLG
ncbi:MAG: lysophospholipid acyltransferase family protein [Patescibacteria group bacterium]